MKARENRQVRNREEGHMKGIPLIILAVSLGAVGQIVMKRGMQLYGEVGDGPNHLVYPAWLVPIGSERWAPLYGAWYAVEGTDAEGTELDLDPRDLSLIHISEPTRLDARSRMPSSA